MLYHKDKAYFAKYIRGRRVMARTACIILRYSHRDEEFVLAIEGKKDILEFPGGKVEVGDHDIYDTCFREMWEEIILKDEFAGDSHHLSNWCSIRQDILASNGEDEQMCRDLYNRLRHGNIVTYGNCPLKTVYFILDISLMQAQYLIEQHNMISIPVELFSFIVAHNRKVCRHGSKKRGWGYDKSSPDLRFRRKNTHFCADGKIYRLRGRDFEGMFRFTNYLC